MAHFAKINSDNIVEKVITIHNNELLDNGIESELKGIEFCKSLLGQNTNWVQTSYNTRGGVHILGGIPLRKNYASIGYTYDSQRDAFIEPKPFNSWTLDENTCYWEPPVLRPNNVFYQDNFIKPDWDEENLRWISKDNQNNTIVWDPLSLTWSPLL